MNIYEDSFEADFADELDSSVLIQPWLRNTGYADVYGEGTTYDCHCQYETFNITKSDGTLTATTMQIYLSADIVIGIRDKITINGVSPKVLRISPDPSNYGQVIFT